MSIDKTTKTMVTHPKKKLKQSYHKIISVQVILRHRNYFSSILLTGQKYILATEFLK